MSFSSSLLDAQGELRLRLVEMVDAWSGSEPHAGGAPARVVHRAQDAALEVEVGTGVEERGAHRAHGFVEDHLAIWAALEARHPVALEEELAVDVVGVLEEAVDGALDGAPEVPEGAGIWLGWLGHQHGDDLLRAERDGGRERRVDEQPTVPQEVRPDAHGREEKRDACPREDPFDRDR